MNNILSKEITFILFLAAFFAQSCLFGQSVAFQGNEEYKRLVNEYKDLDKRHAKLLEQTRTCDSTFARAADWLKYEQKGTNPPVDKDFFATLQEEDRKRYRDWQRGVSSRISLEVSENEWKRCPDSHRAFLLLAAGLIKQENAVKQTRHSQSNIEGNPTPEKSGAESYKDLFCWVDVVWEKIVAKAKTPQVDIGCIPEISDDSQWTSILKYLKASNADLISQIPLLTKSLDIKQEIICDVEKRVMDVALFDVYDFYYRFYYPVGLKDIEKKQSEVANQLSTINPDWWYDEGIESRDPTAVEISPVVRFPFYWVFIGFGIIVVVCALVRIFLKWRDTKWQNIQMM